MMNLWINTINYIDLYIIFKLKCNINSGTLTIPYSSPNLNKYQILIIHSNNAIQTQSYNIPITSNHAL